MHTTIAALTGLRPESQPGPQAQVAEMQRRRLLSALVDVAARSGLEGATVGAVCRSAGVSRRTFYDLFEDRQACFMAAFDESVSGLGEELATAWDSHVRWRERVRAALALLLARFEQEPALARLCLVESLKGGPEVLERRRAALDALIAAIDQGRDEAKSTNSPLPELAAESVVGGAFGVIQARVLDPSSPSLMGLLNSLMAMIVQPYLGAAAAHRQLEQPPITDCRKHSQLAESEESPFKNLPIRVTFRTARVLETIGSHPNASNRDIAHAAGVSDQGQASKLLWRLQRAELIQNCGQGQGRGERNAWRLTARGDAVLRVVGATAES